jgi:hypothetical protein
MTGKIWLGAAAAIGAVLLGVTGFAPRLASADDAGATASCGSKDNPCPLQKWMRANMGTPLAAGDLDSVGKALDRVAPLAPDPSWSIWATSSNAGSAAAKNKDTAGVKASCKSCHDAYKDKYKAQYRARPFN